MLLQSQHDEIHILPAIPNAWGSGSYSGLKARNAFEVSVSWKNHNAQLVKIKSIVGNKCTLRSSNKLFFKDTNQFSVPSGKEFLLVFETQPGKEYTIISK
jgi:alpha-L-fucosidase 2